MKCPHCQSEWKVSAGLGVTVQECPFCRKSLLPQPGVVPRQPPALTWGAGRPLVESPASARSPPLL